MAGNPVFEFAKSTSDDINRETPKFGRLPKSVKVPEEQYRRLLDSVAELERVKAQLIQSQGSSDSAQDMMQRINRRLNSSGELAPVDDTSHKLLEEMKEQVKINRTLSEQLREVQSTLSSMKSEWKDKLQALHNKKLSLQQQLETARLETTTPENVAKAKHDKTKLVEAYRRLTCMQINQMEDGCYQLRVSMNRAEITFTLRETGDAYDYHLVSHTCEAERLSEVLKSDINFARSLGPKFLMSVVKCLT
jgi:chromosome segregation ATPase